jgi:hypothetical protein
MTFFTCVEMKSFLLNYNSNKHVFVIVMFFNNYVSTIHDKWKVMNVIKIGKLIKQNSSQNVVFKIRIKPWNIRMSM